MPAPAGTAHDQPFDADRSFLESDAHGAAAAGDDPRSRAPAAAGTFGVPVARVGPDATKASGTGETGEAGISHAVPDDQQDSFFMGWPWSNAWCGDLDLCGFKKRSRPTAAGSSSVAPSGPG